jgi:hypothetical protein
MHVYTGNVEIMAYRWCKRDKQDLIILKVQKNNTVNALFGEIQIPRMMQISKSLTDIFFSANDFKNEYDYFIINSSSNLWMKDNYMYVFVKYSISCEDPG